MNKAEEVRDFFHSADEGQNDQAEGLGVVELENVEAPGLILDGFDRLSGDLSSKRSTPELTPVPRRLVPMHCSGLAKVVTVSRV